ncbi:hypothetical protein FPOAC1_007839 [Fusarium poae]|uniref:hypothetical protein n=1 Tax=Fusarium poae TaxID=36050 RepID=UPI001CEB381B|nr:hypothetical protein FPOAC1_007839 [Fusarium poae]KAG8668460.1 hypothetical protein FPOAC1_007839 [Fusarium poae]
MDDIAHPKKINLAMIRRLLDESKIDQQSMDAIYNYSVVPRAELEEAQHSVEELKEKVARLEASLEHESRQNATHSKILLDHIMKLEPEQKRAEHAMKPETELTTNITTQAGRGHI